jgi:putative transposase
MILTYQYKLNPTDSQALTLEMWSELLRRHWNYALLNQRSDAKPKNYFPTTKTSMPIANSKT